MLNKLLKLYFSREQKADLVDCLIQLDYLSGFSLYDIDGFSRNHERFDVGEQIRGARGMLMAEVICSVDDVARIREALSQLHFKEPIRYVMQSVEDVGHSDYI
ncbi:MAG TPA: DUF3240 domain-containing protein [Idiomarina abyssalis]|jgi:hypothetical protein|uniref:DUF3240 family protein n=1 Tax=Idiomarina TaxID=135575 RepID=UPI000C683CDF|nr:MULTISPECIES: DUF3240 family protein [Idiomarina]MAB21627.1 hypothetical protein [Idiomarina sp.]MBH93696.1 hypothetical protein [Idiomarina sp.]QZN92078.1 DUF3240 family protein [Idiomarina abyssalis]HAS14938.1 DUF3240 domain-containing protein [Idiomarina abyssalis]|tara:strand:- start:1841 stop:2149 length:309 start_codon:yes stop_codon:yes gene_type:complete